MTKEQKARIDRKCREIKDEYVKDCNKIIFEKRSSVVSSADMLQKISNVVKTELVESEEKDKIIKTLTDNLNDFIKDCDKRVSKEYGNIMGADYMYRRLLDILYDEINIKEESEKNKKCYNCKWYGSKKCMPTTCQMIGPDGHGLWEEKKSEE